MDAYPQFLEITPGTWEEAKSILMLLGSQYIYRGQSDSKWPLETSLTRAAAFNTKLFNMCETERKILNLFKTRAHHYIESPPKDEDYIEWLSLIQDHGGPSRLLHFSVSFYVAAFFAAESVNEMGCIWAISRLRLLGAMLWAEKGKFYKMIFGDLPSSPLSYEDYSGEPEDIIRFAQSFIGSEKNREDLVLKVIPPRLNERLAVQKGIFLFPCNIDKTFEFNLCGTFELPFDRLDSRNATQMNCQEFVDFDAANKSMQEAKTRGIPMTSVVPILKINLSKEISQAALNDLYDMNIDYASLFPGLDGFTRSLNFHVYRMLRVVGSYAFPPKDEEPKPATEAHP